MAAGVATPLLAKTRSRRLFQYNQNEAAEKIPLEMALKKQAGGGSSKSISTDAHQCNYAQIMAGSMLEPRGDRQTRRSKY
jgi:hypothetical protein